MTASGGEHVFVADVAYDDELETASAAALVLAGWSSAVPIWDTVVHVEAVAPYRSGAFYERELPCLLTLLAAAERDGVRVDVLVVDGYASFGPGKPALGAYLHRATGKPVVGVAKTPFASAEHVEVHRGESRRPLYVTAVGLGPLEAAERVRRMHGEHRIPTALARVDRLARAAQTP